MSSTKTVMSQAAGAGVAPDGTWDLSYAYYDDPLFWDVSSAYFKASFSVATQETGTRGVSLSPDGTKMYIVGVTGDDVNQYTLSTPFLVSSATYVQRFYVFAQVPLVSAIFFKPDGTKMYISGTSSNRVNEYDLSTAWDISTASYLQNLSVTPQVNGVFIRSDGLKMYTVDSSTGLVYEYDLSTAWDVTTASVLQNLSVSAQDTLPEGLSFKADGTKMFVLGNTGDDVTEYDLSTAWDISTATVSTTFSVSGQDINPRGLFIDANGGYMYVAGVTAPSTVYQYNLGGFSVSAQEAIPNGVIFKPDGTKMYIIGSGGDAVHEYDLSTAWDTSTASFLQTFSVAGQDLTPQDLSFKLDGTKMYMVGSTGDDVNEYDLSTAWDISTAVFSQLFSVAVQELAPQGIHFKPDGSKMYIAGNGGDAIYEYDISTAWDISTSSFLQSFSVTAQETNPQGVSFKPDGTKMYMVGSTGDDVNEYDLSTAWDISTAVFSQLFSVQPQDTTPYGFFLKPDGTQMFIVGAARDSVFTYSIGVQPTA